MRAHTEAYRRMTPWCGKMKQLLEQNGLDEPPKPDFARCLPPLLMDTMDVGSGSHDESTSDRFRVPHPPIAPHFFPLNFQFSFYCIVPLNPLLPHPAI